MSAAVLCRRQLTDVVEQSLPRTWVLIDEAQVLAPSDEQTLSGEALVKFAKEGRNYGLSMALTSQQPAAVFSGPRGHRNGDAAGRTCSAGAQPAPVITARAPGM